MNGDGERFFVQPKDCLLTTQARLTIDPLMPKPYIAIPIHPARRPECVKYPLELLVGIKSATNPGQHIDRTQALVPPTTVGPMVLEVEVRDPPIMHGNQIIPGGGLGEMEVRHAALHVELSLN